MAQKGQRPGKTLVGVMIQSSNTVKAMGFYGGHMVFRRNWPAP